MPAGRRRASTTAGAPTRAPSPDRIPVRRPRTPSPRSTSIPPRTGCAVTGGYVYRGAAIPDSTGAYVFGDFCNGRLQALRLTAGRSPSVGRLGLEVANLASFGEDAAGNVYVFSLAGGMFRIDGGLSRRDGPAAADVPARERCWCPTPSCPCTSSSPATGRWPSDCLAGDRRVRGRAHRAGPRGGRRRLSASRSGTVARIIQAVELPDGRWLLEAVGAERIPGERAGSTTIPTRAPRSKRWPRGPAGPDAADLRQQVERLLKRTSPSRPSWAAAAVRHDRADRRPRGGRLPGRHRVAPGADRHPAVLEAPGPEARLRLLATLLDDQVDLLSRRMAQG